MDKDVNFDIQDNEGNTPLHQAVATGDFMMVDVLTDLGANPGSVNKAGQMPHELANADVKIVKILESRRKTWNNEARKAAIGQNIQ